MINQKTAVVNVILSIFPDYVLGGEVILKSLLNPENKKQMRATLFEGFRAGEISFSKTTEQLNDDAYLCKYVSSLLDNWVRKNKDFNNGITYEGDPAKKGSRSGSQDAQIKSLRGLRKKYASNSEVTTEIDEAIAARLAEIKPDSVIEINVDALPEQFKHLVASI